MPIFHGFEGLKREKRVFAAMGRLAPLRESGKLGGPIPAPAGFRPVSAAQSPGP